MLHLKLDNLVKDTDPAEELKFKSFTFNGGEEHIVIEPSNRLYDGVLIEVSMTSSKKLMQTLIATDALKRMGYEFIELFCPYLPYARQDRVCNEGESLSIKVICDLINAQNYFKVHTLDNHSEVAGALLNNWKPINFYKIFDRAVSNGISDYKEIALVSPDAGALKRVYNLSKGLGGVTVIECSKKRDVTDGKILKTEVHDDFLKYEKIPNLLIVDDICDGGRTFIELAKALKEKGAQQIDLYVSHGIFSQGLNVLIKKDEPWNGLIDNVYTTRSFLTEITDKIGQWFEYEDFS